MELELKKSRLDVYETGGELVVTQEETAETIVPDYCPDIARIISTEGTVFLRSRELRDGKAELSGTVRVSVLYTPEGERGIRTLEFALPFTMESESQALPGCVCLIAEAETEVLETRMLNPRKVFTHCKLVGRMTGYRRTALQLCNDLVPPPQISVEKRQEHQRVILLTQIAEKDFTFTDIMHLSPGRDGAAELISSRVRSAVTETKLVGNKLIFKGMFSLSCLYRTAEGACCTTTAELPFSQIMEVDGVSEEAVATVRVQLTGFDFQIDGDDPEGRQVAVTLYLHATAMLREESWLTLLTDLYSTAYDMTYDAEAMVLTGFWEEISRRITVREILEIGVVAESILSVSVTCCPISVARERESATVRTTAAVRALYLDEGGTPLVAGRTIDVACQVELPQGCQLTARAFCLEEPQATLGDRGIEVRFPVDFHLEACSRVQKACVSAVQLDTEAPKDTSGAPSLVLRRMHKQESLWDLAKKHHTTIPAILAANQLEREEDISREKLLLIPKKRA